MTELVEQVDNKKSGPKNMSLDLLKIKMIPASLEDYPVIQNMARFYVYDMSEYMGFTDDDWALPENGLYECLDFKKYWLEKDSFPFLIRYENELAGFVIIDKKGSSTEIEFNMAQFFILRKFKSKGVGKYIATECFNRYNGIWEVMVMPENEGAYHFWKSVIHNFTDGSFVEYNTTVPHLNNSIKNIFRFTS